MGERKLTLFELHLHGDTQFGPNIGEQSGSDETAEDEDGVPEIEIEADGGAPTKGLLGLVVLLVALFAAKRLLGGDDEAEFEDPEETED